jgi:probable rRNA maturation factor
MMKPSSPLDGAWHPNHSCNPDGARGPATDIVVESPLWEALPRAGAIVRRAIVAAAETDRAGACDGAAVAVLLCDDAAIAALNAHWRGLDRPTNVLSFPAPDRIGSAEHGRPQGRGSIVPGSLQPPAVRRTAPIDPAPLGDIAIAYETVAREAEAEDKPVADHLAHLAVHGFLHLLGYDHQDDGEAERMERLERDILARIGIADPYAGDAG